MFTFKKKDKEIEYPSDVLHESIIAQIYCMIKAWWEKENLNAEKGTPVEQGTLGAIVNFDFSGFEDGIEQDIFDSSVGVLEDIFTTKENCFINSRIRLMASEIIERFGIAVIDEFNKRLKYSLVHIWKVKEEIAEELIAEYPCLWLIHIIQSFAILEQSNN